jgi:hypothetical protein
MKRLIHKCPNCGEPVAGHPDTGCVLNALVQIIRERGEIPEVKVRKIHREVDVDALWEELGPVVDRLQEGVFK